jgi:4-hydroxyphenylpyruvate dioxygenase
MEALGATGYEGLLSLEIFNDEFRGGTARGVAIDGQRSLIALFDRLRARTGRLPRGAAALPPRVVCHGTEFIEFAVDEAAAPSFAAVLKGLGFRHAGQHVSKSVARWNQGAINLVVNSEKEGFAHSYNITHGTSVCAIALKVDDAGAALDRAERLLDQPFRQAVGPGEVEIPCVRGLGGSLLHFVDAKHGLDRLWDVDFAKVDAPRAPDAGLFAVDHISQSMQYEEMLSWLLFYTALLDLSKTPQQDVIDPGGLVKSQVVQSADGSLRIALNASQSTRTLSSRFLSEAFGSGVQHIAFATSDILATARRLAECGVKLLPIPPNYYDDLEAKTGLPLAVIAELQRHNILYDNEGGAEYLQAYTRTFDDRFFFEIVERRGYRGFGAANAPIRLAAQSRLAARPIRVLG